ncbi:hypothetical protein E2C01_069112 [Portunus trituberculatus]|uniref:Uncharacterized protein n=1 Tax=Portunus trituberculatus TaxID=210409 RepID=A0A5B7I1B2_PORTR|nr:hypothetical protein [Portunus trituberculatus]
MKVPGRPAATHSSSCLLPPTTPTRRSCPVSPPSCKLRHSFPPVIAQTRVPYCLAVLSACQAVTQKLECWTLLQFVVSGLHRVRQQISVWENLACRASQRLKAFPSACNFLNFGVISPHGQTGMLPRLFRNEADKLKASVALREAPAISIIKTGMDVREHSH